jgi:cobalt-zinc-cadmium efflux system outer membrane protein
VSPLPRSRRVLLLALLAVPTAAAPAEPGAPLRWEDVVAFVAASPLVLEADARVDGASGSVASARSAPNPTFTVTGGDAQARNGPERRREWGVSVEVPLEYVATRGPRVAAAKATERAAAVEAKGARVQALRIARREFVALAHGQAQVEAQLELEAQVARLAGLVRTRAERGEARPTEVPRVEIELERLRFAIARTRAGVEALRVRLSTTLGVPVTRVQANLERAPDLPPLPELEDRVTGTAPSVEAARARIAAAAEELSAERRERIPKLSVGAGHVEELDRRATSVTATVSLPLWNWNGGKIRQAEAGVAVERARLYAAAREIRATASDAWHACAAGQASSARFREQVLPRAEVAARTTGRAFELGEAGLLDLIDTRRVLLDTRREYLDLLLDMQNACGDLAAVAGLELP